MAYSMFERPKLYNVRSLKFYPEDYDHHVPFRHKTLPPDFELTVENPSNPSRLHQDHENFSLEAHSSNHSKKCPIYIHTFNTYRQNEGDFVPKTERQKKSKNRKLMIDQLEEKYWANWKPGKNGLKKSKSPDVPTPPEIQIIKSAPERRQKIKVYPRDGQIGNDFKIEKIPSKSQEIQTDEIPPPLPSLEAEIKEEEEETNQKQDEGKESKPQENEPQDKGNTQTDSVEKTVETKFLKHTDSLILNIKKQKEEKEHYEQPKCIRLYRKAGKIAPKNYVKGGSYPLKSCLKKESNVTKGSIKLGRPGSPMISSSFSNKHTKPYRY